MKIIVLGAGVIGTTTAYFLARAGHEVTVIEKNSTAASGCSYANGGQLSYSHIETWAGKKSISSLARAAILPNSFLSISPSAVYNFGAKDFSRWLWHFCHNSFGQRPIENSKKLFLLSTYSQKVLAEILSVEENLQFDYQSGGILHFYRNQKNFESAIKEAEFCNSLGGKSQIFSPDECIQKEPTLVKIFDEKKLAGGIFYSADASGNSFLFTEALAKICQEKYGVVFEYSAEVKNIFTNYQKITGIHTSKGVFTAEKYVYALGASGIRLLQGIKIDPDIYPVKGYSLSIPADQEFIAPKIALTDPENKIVYSRLGNVFRVAGMVEICGLNSRKNKQLVKFLSDKVRSTFSDCGNWGQAKPWFEFRPFRPNSLPLICEVKKYGNLLINTGHGSLGWTLSAASGKILADLVEKRGVGEFGFLGMNFS